MSGVQTKIRIHVFHTGRVCVSPGLPFKDKEKNPHPVQLTLLSAYGRRQRIWLPVSAYLIEHPQGRLLVDTGWHREISPQGEYSRFAQIRHLGLAHFLLNQGVLPKWEALVEQLARLNIQPKDIDYVLLTHLHCGQTSGLAAVKISHGGKFVLLFSDGGYAEKSWQEMIPPGTALDEKKAYQSLQWIREMSQKEECLITPPASP